MKKSTKIIIAVVAVIVVAAAVVATLFLTGVIGKKAEPKKAFYEYLDKVTSGTDNMSYSSMLAKLKDVQAKPFSGKGKISMDVELKGSLSQYENYAKILNNTELSFETKVNPTDTIMYSSINVKYSGKDLGTIEVLGDKEQVGVKIADIYDKYFTITMDEIKSSLKKEGLDLDSVMSSTSSIDTDSLIELLDVSDSEIDRIVKRYADVLKSSIPESNYSSEKEKITVNGKDINATGYTVKISDKDLVKLLNDVLASLKEDDDTLQLVVNKVNKVMEIAGERTTISKRDLTSGIDTLISSLGSADELTGEEVKITVYEYKNDTVRIKLAMADDAIIIDTMKDGDTENVELKLKMDGTEMTILNMEQTKKGDGKYFTKLSTDIEGIKAEISADTEMSGSSEKANMKLYVEVAGMIKATLNIDEEIEYGSVSIDKLSSSNTKKISSFTQTDAMELVQNAVKYVEAKMDIIKDIAKLLGYEDEVETFAQQLKTLGTQTTTTTTTPTDADVDTDTAA